MWKSSSFYYSINRNHKQKHGRNLGKSERGRKNVCSSVNVHFHILTEDVTHNNLETKQTKDPRRHRPYRTVPLIYQTENCEDIKVISWLSVPSGPVGPERVLKRIIVTKTPSTISFTRLYKNTTTTTQHASVCFWGIILFSPRLHLQTHRTRSWMEPDKQLTAQSWNLRIISRLRLQTI